MLALLQSVVKKGYSDNTFEKYMNIMRRLAKTTAQWRVFWDNK